MNLTSLLVGAHFNPPAKTLISALPAGALLILHHEPDNPYDEHAIAVFISNLEIPASQHAKLEEELPLQGFTLEEVLSQLHWKLGHVAASGGKPLLKAEAAGYSYVGNLEFLEAMAPAKQGEAKLAFDDRGEPLVVFTGASPLDWEK